MLFLGPMDIKNGDILTGFVEKVLPYGAFVSLPGGKSGLLHISEMNCGLTKNMKNLLSEGEQVKVQVIGVSLEGKISLSVKKLAMDTEFRPGEKVLPSGAFGRAGVVIEENRDFEDQLKRFVRKSRANLLDAQKQLDRKTGRKKKKK